MSVCCECYVLTGIGLCGELITCPEILPTVARRCVSSRNLGNEEVMVRIGPQRYLKKGVNLNLHVRCTFIVSLS
jgi:hypothetical protein